MLVMALSVVKSCYFYMKFSRLIQISKPVKKKGEKNKHFTQKTGAALVRTINSVKARLRKQTICT